MISVVSKQYNVVILNKSIVTKIMCKLSFKKRTCPHTCACFCNTGRDHQKPALRHVRWELQPNMAVHEQSVSALADQTGTRVYGQRQSKAPYPLGWFTDGQRQLLADSCQPTGLAGKYQTCLT